ncbi:MAG: transcription antitermination factor NusB [Dysgonamonadaceae bacterium]|jgi:N utilization substance protein B|nr:transcription antitermination factor NusB [Dysgonamonadaceae bacterium]
MINRVIIRIKVLQIVYAYYLKNGDEPDRTGNSFISAENELLRSLQHAYDLYHYLLLLIVLLTDAEQKRVDLLKHKLLPTREELNPNKRLANNRLAEQLRVNKTLQKFINSHGTLWNNENPNFIKNVLTKIISSDIYEEYLESEDTYESDKDFWRKLFKSILLDDDELREIAIDNSIYVDDDVDVVATFVVKTIKRFEPENGANQELLPMFKNDEDYRYAIHLLHRTIVEENESAERINKQIKNWELDRIASIDLYIMQIALAELRNFPTIPINVTLNEYIDLARYYSTPKSAHFINGILDAIVNELKSEGLLFKN